MELGPQTLPQTPQLLASVATVVQVLPQTIWPAGQAVHWPETHEAPTAHALPHTPQFFASAERSAQPEGQVTSPTSHVQMLVLQFAPALQILPQSPQLALSLVMSEQTPLQSICPTGQAQTPEVQVEPTAQAFPHMPQLFTSAERSVQVF
jgi:hypothetical protein